MKNRFKVPGAILLLLIFAVGQNLFASDGVQLRRYALFVGANDGGSGRVYLRYAETDALSMAEVMRNIGGIDPSNSRILLNPESADLAESLESLSRLAEAGRKENSRVEFLLYYSGHSDEYGLLLKGQNFPYQRLKEAIQNVTADVHIAILDSCSSGSFTRLKGGQKQRPFLLDESVDTSGYAFLTSSSENEAAQESDEIEGSFFTHFLLTGLMGAADHTKNGQVSLNEAYSYASEQTLARTELTMAGAQHPSYDMKLSGSGDLVLTDIRSSSASLMITPEILGRLFIRDGSGKLIAEINKHGKDSFIMALPPGYYTVTLENKEGISRTSLSIGYQQTRNLFPGQFTPEQRIATTSRGSGQPEEEILPVRPYEVSLFSPEDTRFLVDGFALGLIDSVYAVKGIQLGFITSLEGYLDGIQGSYLFGSVEGNMNGIQAAGVFNTLEGTSHEGIQVSGVFNTAEAPLQGAQISGVFNTVEGNLNGFQISGVFNSQEGELMEGFQTAGIFNTASGGMKGFQLAGVGNFQSGGSFQGSQASGVINITSGSLEGFQTAGIYNQSADLKGMQIGLINKAADIRGNQIGLINISDSYTRGFPVGLINLSRDGLHHLNLWSDSAKQTYMGVQLGTKRFYSLLYGGTAMEEPREDFSVGVGLGFHTSHRALFIDVDLGAKSFFLPARMDDPEYWVEENFETFPSLRMTAGLRFAENFSVIGGVSVDGWLPDYMNGALYPLKEGEEVQTYSSDNFSLAYVPRWFLGIRL